VLDAALRMALARVPILHAGRRYLPPASQRRIIYLCTVLQLQPPEPQCRTRLIISMSFVWGVAQPGCRDEASGRWHA
jgi:hypothetical protein